MGPSSRYGPSVDFHKFGPPSLSACTGPPVESCLVVPVSLQSMGVSSVLRSIYIHLFICRYTYHAIHVHLYVFTCVHISMHVRFL